MYGAEKNRRTFYFGHSSPVESAACVKVRGTARNRLSAILTVSNLRTSDICKVPIKIYAACTDEINAILVACVHVDDIKYVDTGTSVKPF